MPFHTAVSTASELDTACREVTASIRTALGQDIDLCIVFTSTRYGELNDVPGRLHDALCPRHLIGCAAGGVIGEGREIESEPALVVTAARLANDSTRSVHLRPDDLPGPDAPPDEWADLVGVARDAATGFIVLPDPFTFHTEPLLRGLDYAFPNAPKIGGLASGGEPPNGHQLFVDRRAHTGGAAVLALADGVLVDPVVAQGCRPIGGVGRITSCENNHLIAVNGRAALQFVVEQITGLEADDREAARTTPVFLGIAMDPFQFDEPAAGDFLIRNLLDVDRATGMIVVGDHLSVGRRVQLHLRDADASDSDLRAVLGRRAIPRPDAALMFSCLGRGTNLFDDPDHDSTVVRELCEPTSLGGFFCNGEIGPVGDTTYVHGYTAAIALLREAPA